MVINLLIRQPDPLMNQLLIIDLRSPPHPHRVEAYFPHLSDTYNRTYRERLGSSRTRKQGEKILQKNLGKTFFFLEHEERRGDAERECVRGPHGQVVPDCDYLLCLLSDSSSVKKTFFGKLDFYYSRRKTLFSPDS